ncbi:MAG: hypothetical protein ACOZNI_35515 [Myxococcota bacterium]
MRVLLPLLLLTACTENELGVLTNEEYFEQASSNAVDILWVIDNSPSMQNEQAAIAEGAASFIDHVESTDMDFHIGVIDSDMASDNPNAGKLLGNPTYLHAGIDGYEDMFRAVVMMDGDGDDKERSFEAAVAALTPPLTSTANFGFLREEALLAVIFVSDENDCSDFGALGPDASGEDCYEQWERLTPVADIVRMFQDIKDENQVILSGIVGPDLTAGCADSVPGKRYYTAIEMTGGVNASVCSSDYAAVMDALGLVASGIQTVFPLEKNAKEDTIEVWVKEGEGDFDEGDKVTKDATNGWTYIVEYAQIEFHGTAVPPRGSRIKVAYQIAPGAVQVEDTASTSAE